MIGLNQDKSTMVLLLLPKQLIQYQLLPFCIMKSAVKLTQASRLLFDTLRLLIRREEEVKVDHFVRQSLPTSNRIGVCCFVRITNKRGLRNLLKHYADDCITQVHPLLHLKINLNQPLGDIVLPSSLYTLVFSHHFNQPLAGITLPARLKELSLGNMFNQTLVGITLPSTIHTLTFGNDFNQSLDCVTLPSSLQRLTFGYHFNQLLANVTLPTSLRTLTVGRHFTQSLIDIRLHPDIVVHRQDLYC